MNLMVDVEWFADIGFLVEALIVAVIFTIHFIGSSSENVRRAGAMWREQVRVPNKDLETVECSFFIVMLFGSVYCSMATVLPVAFSVAIITEPAALQTSSYNGDESM